MGYYEDLLAQKKKKTEDLVSGRPEQANLEEQKIRDLLASRDVQARGNVQDILGGVSAQYGISPSISAAGGDIRAGLEPQLQRRREVNLAQQKNSNLRRAYQQMYDYALNAYQNAGYNLQQSDAFARQWAQQQSQQQFEAENASQNRDYLLARDKISAQYGDIKSGLQVDQGNPYQDALIRSLTGLAPYAGYALYQKYGQQPIRQQGVYQPFGTTQNPYGPGQNLGYYPQLPAGGTGGYQY